MCLKFLRKKSYGRVNYLWKFPKSMISRGNRKIKDKLFRDIFSKDKKALLQLYNALNNSDYKNWEDLEVITIDDVLYIGMKNDLTFLLIGTINLYEHQSTYNVNIPLRFLHYISLEYLRFVDYTAQNVYGERLIMLPTPHFVVFYNGEKEIPDEQILRLSDSYEVKREEKSLEVTVKMINVNYGRSNELMKKCSRLEEYSIFIHQVRVNIKKGMKLNKAIDEAVFYCIEKGVLVDYLKKHRFRARMYGMLEYGSNWHMYMERRDAREAGWAEGHAEGHAKGHAEGHAEGRLEGEILGTIKMCKEFALSKEDTLNKIICKFNLEEENAKQIIEQHW